MNKHVEKTQQNNQPVAKQASKNTPANVQFNDNRPEAVAQMKMQRIATENSKTYETIQWAADNHCIQLGKARPSWKKGLFGETRDSILRRITIKLYKANVKSKVSIGDQNLARLHNVSWDDIDNAIGSVNDATKVKNVLNKSAAAKYKQLLKVDHQLAIDYDNHFKMWGQLYASANTISKKKAELFEHPGNVYQLGPSDLNSAVNKTFHGNTVDTKSGREASPASANNVGLSASGIALTQGGMAADGQGRKYDRSKIPEFATLPHTRTIKL